MTEENNVIFQTRNPKPAAPVVDHETQKFKLSTELNFQKTIIVFLMSVIVVGLLLPYLGSYLHNEVKIFDSTATLVQLLIQILSASLAYTLGASKDKDGNSQPGQPTRLNPPSGNPGQQPGGYPLGQGGPGGPGQPSAYYQGYQQQYNAPYQPQGQYVAPQYVQQPGQLQPPFANPVQPTNQVLQPGPATQPPPPITPRPPAQGGRG